MALTKEQLDQAAALGCQLPGCRHEGHELTLFLKGRCHPRGAVQVTYEQGSGVLVVTCAECEALVVQIAVAKEEEG